MKSCALSTYIYIAVIVEDVSGYGLVLKFTVYLCYFQDDGEEVDEDETSESEEEYEDVTTGRWNFI